MIKTFVMVCCLLFGLNTFAAACDCGVDAFGRGCLPCPQTCPDICQPDTTITCADPTSLRSTDLGNTADNPVLIGSLIMPSYNVQYWDRACDQCGDSYYTRCYKIVSSDYLRQLRLAETSVVSTYCLSPPSAVEIGFDSGIVETWMCQRANSGSDSVGIWSQLVAEQTPAPSAFQAPNASAWLEALIRNYTATVGTAVDAESNQIAPTGTITLNDGRILTNSSTAINFIMPTLVSCPTNLAIDWLDERCEAPIACDPNYSFVATLGVCQLNPGSAGLVEVSPVYQQAPVGLCQVGGATILASESACSGYAGQFSPLAGAISDPATSLSAIGWCQDQGLVLDSSCAGLGKGVLSGRYLLCQLL